MNCVLWIMNHAMTDDQKNDLNWKFESPAVITVDPEMLGRMAQVPAEADTDDVRRLADDIVRSMGVYEVTGPRIVGAIVQGEPTLQTCLVKILQDCGIRCYAATTPRVSVETTQAEGTVVKTNQFKHVRFREYPWIGKESRKPENPFLKD